MERPPSSKPTTNVPKEQQIAVSVLSIHPERNPKVARKYNIVRSTNRHACPSSTKGSLWPSSSPTKYVRGKCNNTHRYRSVAQGKSLGRHHHRNSGSRNDLVSFVPRTAARFGIPNQRTTYLFVISSVCFCSFISRTLASTTSLKIALLAALLSLPFPEDLDPLDWDSGDFGALG